MTTVAELKEYINNLPDDAVVKTKKFNGRNYYINSVLLDELEYYKDSNTFYIDLGF